MVDTLQNSPFLPYHQAFCFLWISSRQGANGGFYRSRCPHSRENWAKKVSITGIDDHELPGLDIVTCVALIQTNNGRFNMIMHQYAYYGRGNTIHSPFPQ